MKQKEFYGKGEKHVYVRKGDKGEILVTKTKDEELITEENTIHLATSSPRCEAIPARSRIFFVPSLIISNNSSAFFFSSICSISF